MLPRLEYAVAFDQAAALLEGFRPAAGPFLAMVTSPTFMDAVLSRAEGPLNLAAAEHVAAHAAQRLAGGLLPPSIAGRTRIVPQTLDGVGAAPRYGRVLWATPQPATWEGTLARLAEVAAPGALLAVLAGTALGDALRAGRRAMGEGEPRGLARPVAQALPRSGWRLARARPLGSVASAGWAVAARIADRAGRPDLADRAELAHHLAVETAAAPSYVLLLAERTA